MGFTLSVPDKDDRINALAAQAPSVPYDDYFYGIGFPGEHKTQTWRPTMFRGTGAAIGTGVVGGLAATARTVDDGVLALGKAGIQSDLDQSMFWANDPTGDLAKSAAEQSEAAQSAKSPLAEPIQAAQDWSKSGEWNYGSGARALGGAARGLTIIGTGSLFGGPVAGASTLATVEGYNTYRDVQADATPPDKAGSLLGPSSTTAPVDQRTALKMAGVTAAASFAGALLPLGIGKGAAAGLLGLGMKAEAAGSEALATSYYGAARAAATVATNPAARLGTAALVNTGFGAANRYATSSVLSDAGYKDMAAQYAPLDAQSLASDFIMGLAFGAHAEIHEAMAGREPSVAAQPPPSVIDAALATRRQEMVARGGAGIPVDPAHANLDMQLQDGALADVLRGRDVSVPPDVADRIVTGTLRDPARAAVNDTLVQTIEDQHGLLADFGDIEPAGAPRTTSDFLTDASAAHSLGDVAATGEQPAALAHLSDYSNESLRQIASSTPDLSIDMGNGVSMRAADLPRAMAADVANVNETARLHDAALACFARTL